METGEAPALLVNRILFFEQLKIRAATGSDRDAIWEIFHEVVAAGDTYAINPKISREEALAYWFQNGNHVYIAEIIRNSAGEGVGFPATLAAPPPIVSAQDRDTSADLRCLLGTYILRANQSGGGAHVGNAAFMVATEGRGKGIGRAMAEHCLKEARRLGFRAMQFNFVVSTNDSAIRLWKNLGFEIVGTLPKAFRHPQKGFVDVYVMFRSLNVPTPDASPRSSA